MAIESVKNVPIFSIFWTLLSRNCKMPITFRITKLKNKNHIICSPSRFTSQINTGKLIIPTIITDSKSPPANNKLLTFSLPIVF